MTKERLQVTQEDREAAASWAKMQGRNHQAANMRRGSCDDAPLVQAFARHRLAALEAQAAEITALRAQCAETIAALGLFTAFGCPACPGDCASANPPMVNCPTQAALAVFQKHDAQFQKDQSDGN